MRPGYTLIEILVVLFIISIVAGVAVMSLNPSGTKQMETFSHEMTEWVMLAEEEALLQSSPLELSLEENAYEFLNAQSKNQHDMLLSKHTIPSALEIHATPSHIVISTNGDITPFVIYIGKRGQKPRYKITGNSDGTIRSQSLP